MEIRHGSMPTDRPARYAKQLAGHWSHKASVDAGADATVIRFESGQAVALRAVEGALNIEASVPDGDDADRWARVVADHLERFGTKEQLAVRWE